MTAQKRSETNVRFRVFFFALIALVIVGCVNGFHSGAPCSSQFTMSPSAIFHGSPQNTQTRPPPYRFEVVDLNEAPVKTYKGQMYKIRLTGTVPFRGFLVQVRPGTKEGYPIGHLRAGEFIPDLTWTSQGVQVQPCPSTFNDSITHTRNDDKTALEILWRANKNYGPILFVVTVVQSRSVFWTQWLPPSGFLMPDEAVFRFSGEENQAQAVAPGEPSTATIGGQGPAAIPVSRGPVDITDEARQLSRITPDVQFQELRTTPLSPSEAATSTRALFELRTVTTTSPALFIESTTTPSGAGLVTDLPQPATVTDERRPQAPTVSGNRAVSPEVLEGLGILRNKNETDFCVDFPCFNNGTCKNLPAEDRYECLCTSRWTGKQCDIENFCEHNHCRNNAECINGDDDYKCKCRREWAGEFCDRHCPSYLCDNGGTCVLVDEGRGYGCACAPGWTGEKCRQELDLCLSQPCQHGGTCLHKFNGFDCKCAIGFMGTTCHRPCQDIYGSCVIWNEEERCESMRASTKFFDINCASTCKQCIYDNRTLLADVPLPPVLEAFDFILGRWTLNISTQHRFPLDFTAKSTGGYHEEMVFMATPVPMFGTPSVNYSATARNNHDPNDVHINVGFLTLKPLTRPLKVSLMSTGNDGMTIIEEGVLNGTELNLTTQYLAIIPSVDSKAPALVKRSFAITNGDYLRESVERLGNNGQKDYFTKYYYKEKKFSPF